MFTGAILFTGLLFFIVYFLKIIPAMITHFISKKHNKHDYIKFQYKILESDELLLKKIIYDSEYDKKLNKNRIKCYFDNSVFGITSLFTFLAVCLYGIYYSVVISITNIEKAYPLLNSVEHVLVCLSLFFFLLNYLIATSSVITYFSWISDEINEIINDTKYQNLLEKY